MPRSFRLGRLYSRPLESFRAAFPKLALSTAIAALLITILAPLASAQDVAWVPPDRVWVEETGQVVDQTFLDAWRANMILIGKPISKEAKDRIKLDGLKTKERTVQYFDNLALVATYDDKRGDDWNIRSLPLGVDALERDAKRLKDTKL